MSGHHRDGTRPRSYTIVPIPLGLLLFIGLLGWPGGMFLMQDGWMSLFDGHTFSGEPTNAISMPLEEIGGGFVICLIALFFLYRVGVIVWRTIRAIFWR